MNDFYTVDQISSLLNMHPKTIQRYIREGKLRATKIGKGWRIAGHDLSAFTESAKHDGIISESRAVRQVVASSVIDIVPDGKGDAIRIMNTLTASMNAKPSEFGQSSMQFQYLERDNTIRVTLWGKLRFIATMMDTIAMLTDPDDEEVNL